MFDKILIPVDESSGSQYAAHIGLEFAKRLNARVVLTNALIDYATEEDGNRALGPARRNAETLKVGFETRFAEGRQMGVGEGIVQICMETNCDLIVMGTHGREGLERLLLGSVAERVTRQAHVPVMLIRNPQDFKISSEKPFRLEHILVAVDGSPQSQQALLSANNLAAKLGASLEVLYVIPDVPPLTGYTGLEFAPMIDYDRYEKDLEVQSKAIVAGALEQLKTALAKVSDVRSLSVPAKGLTLGDRILQTAGDHGADLIVLGTHGRSGIDRLLLGSVAQTVSHHSKIPVLLVRNLPLKVSEVAINSDATSSQPLSENTLMPNPVPT
jgi:nucleotide-binding universal stress UspA family protein